MRKVPVKTGIRQVSQISLSPGLWAINRSNRWVATRKRMRDIGRARG